MKLIFETIPCVRLYRLIINSAVINFPSNAVDKRFCLELRSLPCNGWFGIDPHHASLSRVEISTEVCSEVAHLLGWISHKTITELCLNVLN